MRRRIGASRCSSTVRSAPVSPDYWFGHHLAGEPEPDEDERPLTEVSTAEIVDGYRAAIEASDRNILAAGSAEARVVTPVDGTRLTLRWVLAHMGAETARHAGHADILREQIDGTTGR